MKYDIVCEGGGAKGSVFVGALKVLEEKKHTLGHLVGTSAGAITATFLAAGYTSSEMLIEINEKVTLPSGEQVPRFTTFMDSFEETNFDKIKPEDTFTYAVLQAIKIPGMPNWMDKVADKTIFKELIKLPVYRKIYSFGEHGAFYKGDKFREWMLEKLRKKYPQITEKTTLEEFYKLTQKELSLVASDVDGQEMLILNRHNAPACSIVWAVRMSMSIPFVWSPIEWKDTWGKYKGRDISKHKIVDGGLLSNFPIDIIVNDDNGNGKLGLLIDEDLEVENCGTPKKAKEEDKLMERFKKLPIVGLSYKIMDTMLSAHDKVAIKENEDKICHLPAKTYGTVEFDMEDARLTALVNAGEKAMRKFLG